MTSMRTETRSIRPFVGISFLEESLQNVHLTRDGEPIEDNSIVLPEPELLVDTFGLSIQISKEPITQLLSPLDLTGDDILVYVVATARTLKTTTCLYSQPLSQFENPVVLEFNRSNNPEIFMDRRGFDLKCCLLLGYDREKIPLKPHKAGTWLAVRDFRVSAETEGISGFNPSRLTAEIKKELSLADTTVTFLELRNSVLEIDDLNSAVAFYVDESLMDTLASTQESPVGQLLQVHFVLEFLMDLLKVVANEIEESKQVGFEDSLFSSDSEISIFVRNAAAQTELPISELFKELRVNPSRVRTRFQKTFDARELSLKSLRSV